MLIKNPYALYVNCDGAMDYDSQNSGGIGFVITFPDFVGREPISISKGTYKGGNIERLELEALISAMQETIAVYNQFGQQLSRINKVIFITDRYHLNDKEKTSAFRISDYRRNKWRNHEQKPIKNHELLDELDKTRAKLNKLARATVSIEYRPRKMNKGPDRLAKAGKEAGTAIDKLSKPGEKIGRRKFDGPEIKYTILKSSQELHIHVFRKDPVQSEWEIWVEICNGDYQGCKLKIYADNALAGKLKRLNEYSIRVQSVFTHHIKIYRTFRKVKKKGESTEEIKP